MICPSLYQGAWVKILQQIPLTTSARYSVSLKVCNEADYSSSAGFWRGFKGLMTCPEAPIALEHLSLHQIYLKMSSNWAWGNSLIWASQTFLGHFTILPLMQEVSRNGPKHHDTSWPIYLVNKWASNASSFPLKWSL